MNNDSVLTKSLKEVYVKKQLLMKVLSKLLFSKKTLKNFCLRTCCTKTFKFLSHTSWKILNVLFKTKLLFCKEKYTSY